MRTYLMQDSSLPLPFSNFHAYSAKNFHPYLDFRSLSWGITCGLSKGISWTKRWDLLGGASEFNLAMKRMLRVEPATACPKGSYRPTWFVYLPLYPGQQRFVGVRNRERCFFLNSLFWRKLIPRSAPKLDASVHVWDRAGENCFWTTDVGDETGEDFS